MSYNPTSWKAGDTVTSAKLNKIEQGIANNGTWQIPFEHDDDNIILGDGNITFAMISEALTNGQNIILTEDKSVPGPVPEYSMLVHIYYYINSLYNMLGSDDSVLGCGIIIADRVSNNSYEFGAPDMNTPLEYVAPPPFPGS